MRTSVTAPYSCLKCAIKLFSSHLCWFVGPYFSAVRRTGFVDPYGSCGYGSLVFFFFVFSFLVWYPFLCSYSLLSPSSSAFEAFLAVGGYFLVLLIFLAFTLYLAWNDENLRTVERPCKRVQNPWHPLHLVGRSHDNRNRNVHSLCYLVFVVGGCFSAARCVSAVQYFLR